MNDVERMVIAFDAQRAQQMIDYLTAAIAQTKKDAPYYEGREDVYVVLTGFGEEDVALEIASNETEHGGFAADLLMV